MAVDDAGARFRPRTAHGRRGLQFVIDAAAWAAALGACAVLRLGPADIHLARIVAIFPALLVAQLAAGYTFGLYRGRSIFGSFEEVATLGRVVLVTGSALFVLDAAITRQRPIPLSSVIVGAVIAFLIMGAARYWWRMVYDRSLRPTLAGRSRVIVFGLGEAGQRVVRAMLRDPEQRRTCRSSRSTTTRSVGECATWEFPSSVIGPRWPTPRGATRPRRFFSRSRPRAAPRSASSRSSRSGPSSQCACCLRCRSSSTARSRSATSASRTRATCSVVITSKPTSRCVAEYLRGRRVAVTGAGGSIGSELCRQLVAFGPSELIMIDRDESALHAVQLSIEGQALLDTPRTVLLDIRDRGRVKRLFLERRPEIVFHAAALKHLPLLEAYPVEALKTNVWGTLAVFEAAQAAGVERFVNVSTDKAANPCSTLGYSKRVAEGLTAAVDKQASGRYLSVRFGNVLGSRGSVLTTFHSQLEAGGPLTVTDPDVTRFFMTVEEAVQLVVQAAGIGTGGEVLVLDMGEPVRIADVAEQLARTVDPPCPISFVGLRPGEKLHEELFGDGEVPRPSSHPLIRSVAVPGLCGDSVRFLDPAIDPDDAAGTLVQLCLAMALELVPALDLDRRGGDRSARRFGRRVLRRSRRLIATVRV